MGGASKPWFRSGTFLIFVALALGILVGGFFPEDRYPHAFLFFRLCSKAFIALIKVLIVPLLFSTIVIGVAQTGDLKAVGRMGGKALLYFEVVTTIALGLGLVIANVFRPGDGLPLDRGAMLGEPIATHPPTAFDLVMHLFPSNVVEHAAKGEILQLVVFAVLFGIALTRIGAAGEPVTRFFEGITKAMFAFTDMIMRLTPIGVFGAMAYNVSHMAAGHEVDGVVIAGWPAVLYLLGRYARLVGSLYLALGLLFAFVFVPVLLFVRVKPRDFFRAIREPMVTAFSTASSEAALPSLLEVLVDFGVPRRVASFVLPAGYSFNLDGSTLYLVLASLTIAQAAGIEMPISQQIVMVVTFMLTSKGVAGVPRATLVIIAGTCASFGLPGEAGIAMILAVDEIMDMARTVTNVTGNALAAVVIAKWERVFGTEPRHEASLLEGATVTTAEAG